jgi:iron-sulfur cluster assembly protein
MFKLTAAAAEQVRTSAEKGGNLGMALRVAATARADGSLDYAVGFDNPGADDVEVVTEGVRVVISPAHAQYLKGSTMDYVELEPGRFGLIFLNPNDPNYSPPTEP